MSTTDEEEEDEEEKEKMDKEEEKYSNHPKNIDDFQCSSKKKYVHWTESTTFHEVKEREDQDDHKEDHQQLVINKVNARHSISSFIDVDLVPYYDKRESLDYETVAKTLANKLGLPELATVKPGLLTPGASVDELRFQLPVNNELEQLIDSLKAYRKTVTKKERIFKPDLPSAFQNDHNDEDENEIDISLNEDIFHELIFDRPTSKLPLKKEQHELELDEAFEMIDTNDDVWKVICTAPGRLRIQSYDGHRLVLRYLWSTVEVHIRFGPWSESSGERFVKRVDLFRMVSPDTHMSDIRLRLAGVEDRPLLDYDPLPWPFQVDDEMPILIAATSPIHYDFQLQVGGQNCVRSSMPSPVSTIDQLMELLWGLNDAAKVGRELAYQLLLIRSAEYCRLSIDQQGMLS